MHLATEICQLNGALLRKSDSRYAASRVEHCGYGVVRVNYF